VRSDLLNISVSGQTIHEHTPLTLFLKCLCLYQVFFIWQLNITMFLAIQTNTIMVQTDTLTERHNCVNIIHTNKLYIYTNTHTDKHTNKQSSAPSFPCFQNVLSQ
jgi:hypothetical protein